MADEPKPNDAGDGKAPEGTDAGKTAVASGADKATPTFKFVDNEGKFVEGWKANLPEEYRDEKSLDLFPDIPTMVKNYLYTQKMRGKNTVAVPNEKSPQDDWDAFYEAIGRTKTVADIQFEKPDDVPDELWNTEFAGKFKEEAWKLGLTPKQIEGIHRIETERLLSAVKAIEEAGQQEKADAEAALKKEWGNAYEERMELANAFIRKTTDEKSGQRDAILELAGNNPQFIRWCAEWGLKTAESKGIDTAKLQKTPAQSMSRVEELRATPGYMDGTLAKTDPPRHRRISQELQELYQKLYPPEAAPTR